MTEILTFLSVNQLYLGGCPKIHNDIHSEQLEGRWYEHSRYPNLIQDNDRCTNFYVLPHRENFTDFAVEVTSYNPSNDKWITTSFNGDGDLLPVIEYVRYYKDIPNDRYQFHEFAVVSTDYTNYAIAYSCFDLKVLPLFHFKLVWILTRQRVPSNETLQVVHNILTENNFSLDRLIEIDQRDCPEVDG